MCLPQDCSWTLRKLFKFSELVHHLIKYIAGMDLRPWLGNWHPIGPLPKLFGENNVRNVGSSLLNSFLHYLQRLMELAYAEKYTIQYIMTHEAYPAMSKPNSIQNDNVIWAATGNGCFPIKPAWNAIRNPRP